MSYTVFVFVDTVLCASESFVKAGMDAGMNTDAVVREKLSPFSLLS